MTVFAKYIVCIFLSFNVSLFFAQQNIAKSQEINQTFVVKGFVYNSHSNAPIEGVNIIVNGGSYTTTNSKGEFSIRVKNEDELIIKYKDFKTVYFTIKNNDDIAIRLEKKQDLLKKSKLYSSRDKNQFRSLIDSAKAYKKTNPEKGIQFIIEALSETISAKQNSEAYETLADIYFYLNQYDLAISNYEISLQNDFTIDKTLKLAKSLRLNKNYQESIKVYIEIENEAMSNYQKVNLYEGIGDVNKDIKQYDEALKAYQTALKIAQKHIIIPKVTDLNSSIADVYALTGDVTEAQDYYSNSLSLASTENKKRALEEKIKVADFQNKNQSYDDEIKLRKDALKDIEGILTEDESNGYRNTPLTPQTQNFKIGSAYSSQSDYDNAIPYLEKSIEEADKKEDIEVKKEATKALSEVYKNIGDYDKAFSKYQEYVDLVDQLYLKKEQEIAQITRFNRDISNKQTRITSLEKDRQLTMSKMELSMEQNKRQKLIIYSLGGGLLLLLFIAYLMLKYIRQQKLANNLLALKSLRSQMNPHFIFNALNSVNSFIATSDERTANKYLSDFSLLMRSVLENSEKDFIPLTKEIKLLELYTKLEHLRFKDKFDYSFTVNKGVKVDEYMIPPMLLQPYVENAVWHGLRYKTEKGKLDIKVSQNTKNEIIITIIDNGVGREKSKEFKTENQLKYTSKGMSNIDKRVSILNKMYQDKVSVYIENYKDTAEDKGTKVVVTIKNDQ